MLAINAHYYSADTRAGPQAHQCVSSHMHCQLSSSSNAVGQGHITFICTTLGHLESYSPLKILGLKLSNIFFGFDYEQLKKKKHLTKI